MLVSECTVHHYYALFSCCSCNKETERCLKPVSPFKVSMEVNINLFHLDVLTTTKIALACVRLSYIIKILFLLHVSATFVAIFREVHYKECWFPCRILIAQCSVVDYL